MRSESPKTSVLFLLATVAFIGLRVIWIDSGNTPFRATRFDGAHIANLQNPRDVNFDNQLVFIGYDAAPTVDSGGEWSAALYWRPATELQTDYSVSLHLVDAQGNLIAQSDHQHPGSYPTSKWWPGSYARDAHTLALPLGTPPDVYTVTMDVYRYGTDEKLNALDENGAPMGTTVVVGTLEVTRPSAPVDSRSLTPLHGFVREVTAGVIWFGHDLDEPTVQAGETLPLTLYWQKTANTTDAPDAFAWQLKDASGAVQAADTVPLVVAYPLAQWQVGDVWVGRHSLFMPPSLVNGVYTLWGGGENLGTVTIQAPVHDFITPTLSFTSAATFGDVARLVGYNVTHAGDVWTVQLAWQAQRETRTQYKVFVQVLNAEGQWVTGDDARPAQWARPTTGWVAGEFVLDTHNIVLPADAPAGEYQFIVGIYDEATQARLGDAVELTQIKIDR